MVKTVFTILSEKPKAMHASDFRPIAVVRLLYKTFASFVLGRTEATSEAQRPEEQRGFRQNDLMEGHLLTANLFFDKASMRDILVWLVGLGL